MNTSRFHTFLSSYSHKYCIYQLFQPQTAYCQTPSDDTILTFPDGYGDSYRRVYLCFLHLPPSSSPVCAVRTERDRWCVGLWVHVHIALSLCRLFILVWSFPLMPVWLALCPTNQTHKHTQTQETKHLITARGICVFMTADTDSQHTCCCACLYVRERGREGRGREYLYAYLCWSFLCEGVRQSMCECVCFPQTHCCWLWCCR